MRLNCKNNKKLSKKILILTPLIGAPEGVASYYRGLRKYLSPDVIYLEYYPQSVLRKKFEVHPLIAKCIRLFFFIGDFIKFVFYILIHCKPIVLLNPSFMVNALKRDSFYLKIAKTSGCKVVVFFHGWDNGLVNLLKKKPHRFRSQWNKADRFIVLSKEQRNGLVSLGIEKNINLLTTKVDDDLLKDVVFTPRKSIKNILFLSRVEKEKGVFIAVEAFKLIKQKFGWLKLKIVGEGTCLKELKRRVSKENCIEIIGPLYGKDVARAYSESDLFILPTYHHEGLPNVVLEAMAFGLPLITRPVGGIKDIFEDDKMGYIIDSLNAVDFANAIEKLILNPDKVGEISIYNRNYAIEHFMASNVAIKLETLLRSL